ncbi:MAG: Y-family DNA polymerase [Candidatus Paracaedibacter sp.]
MIALLDANNFFVSCERVFRPDLMNKPVAVLSNNDGCLISRSNEVKALGVPMGAPYFKYKEVLTDHNVAIFSSHFTLYGDMSGRMMTLIESLVPRLEVYSVDEAFIDLSGIKDIEKICTHIRKTILRSLGIPTSIGIGKTKTLAKVANYYAKRVPAFKSICYLDKPDRTGLALKQLPIGEIWGIGRQISKKLESQGIITAWDLKQVDPRCMRQQFTVVGERIVRELNGISCLAIEDIEDLKKSTQVTRSFGKSITDFQELKSAIATYATRLGEKLRSQNLVTQNVSVFIKTNKHRPTDPQYSNSATVVLQTPVNDDISLIRAASVGLQQIYKNGYAYSKAGIMAHELALKQKSFQLDLFSKKEEESSQSPALWEALDELNKRYGRGTLFSAACGMSLSWKDKKNLLSPSYTTRWDQLAFAFAK